MKKKLSREQRVSFIRRNIFVCVEHNSVVFRANDRNERIGKYRCRFSEETCSLGCDRFVDPSSSPLKPRGSERRRERESPSALEIPLTMQIICKNRATRRRRRRKRQRMREKSFRTRRSVLPCYRNQIRGERVCTLRVGGKKRRVTATVAAT